MCWLSASTTPGASRAMARSQIILCSAATSRWLCRPDGIWATQDGVWVATTTGHAVALVRENELVTSIGTGTLLPIACCGDGGNRLFVTLADTHGLPLGEAMATKAVHTTVALLEIAKAGDTS